MPAADDNTRSPSDPASLKLLGALRFKIATASEIPAALALRSRIYSKERGAEGIDSWDDVALHLVALDCAGTVVGTVRLIEAQYRPFDLENFFNIDRLSPPILHAAEISRFAVSPSARRLAAGQMIHLGLLKLLFDLSEAHQYSDLVSMGLPHLLPLYRAAYFTVTDQSVEHPIWGMAHLMRLNLADTRRRCEERSTATSRLLLARTLPNIDTRVQ